MAALRAHVGDVGVQKNGCFVLGRIAEGGAACAQAVVEAGGTARVVAALRAHPSVAAVQEKGCLAEISLNLNTADSTAELQAAGAAAAGSTAGDRRPNVRVARVGRENLNLLYLDTVLNLARANFIRIPVLEYFRY